jgi:uncharacterized membrane protein
MTSFTSKALIPKGRTHLRLFFLINIERNEMKADLKKKIDIAFVGIVSLFCIILFFMPTGFENEANYKNTERVEAEVTDIDNSDVKSYGVSLNGTQMLKVLVKEGTLEGQEIEAQNIMLGQLSLDKYYKIGDDILLIIKKDKTNQKIISARAHDLYRIDIEIILFVLFALFLVGFAKWTGLKALLSFVFTALAIWKILVPMFLSGYSPLASSFAVVALTTTIIIMLISGFNRKGIVALSGALTGVGLTTVLAIIFGYFFQIPGTVKEFSELLLFSGFDISMLSDIFISGIFISSAGAVMDVAMDIAASQNELKEQKPEITSAQLIKSGFKIAYPVLGTMTTTLLFAYSGSFAFTLMVFMSKGTPAIGIFNINFIAAEVLQTMVGSFGLVLVAPVTAIIGGYIYNK